MLIDKPLPLLKPGALKEFLEENHKQNQNIRMHEPGTADPGNAPEGLWSGHTRVENGSISPGKYSATDGIKAKDKNRSRWKRFLCL